MNQPVDLDLFSDFYKDVHGFRPRGEYWTEETMRAWMDQQQTPEAIARNTAMWEEERVWLEEQEARYAAEERAHIAATEPLGYPGERYEHLDEWNQP